MRSIYGIGIRLYTALVWLAAALGNAKAQLWVQGRRAAPAFPPKGPGQRRLWVHVSSLGEFEQGRPVIEAFRQQFPDWQLVLSFFSPSGYEIRKNYPHADLVCYLPADTLPNARRFLAVLQPDAALFVKYDFWANHLLELKARGVPTLLVSALFRPGQPFFRWYGGLWRQMLGCFSHVFVQNEASAQLLQSIGFQHVSVAGDTRVDRVLALNPNPSPGPSPRGEGGGPLAGPLSGAGPLAGLGVGPLAGLGTEPLTGPLSGAGPLAGPSSGALGQGVPAEDIMSRLFSAISSAEPGSFDAHPPLREQQGEPVEGQAPQDGAVKGQGQEPENRPAKGPPPSPRGEGPGEGSFHLILGSSWPPDEALVLALLQRPAFAAWRCVFVPHDPSPAAVERLLGQLGASAMRYSAALAALSGQPDKLQGLRHLVVDSVGLLNQLYRHARVAYIGGGFGKGIHNTLEPAAFGLPVVFGPRYRKFEEACQLVARGAAFPVEDTDALADALLRLSDAANYRHAAQAALGYLEESRGATEKAIAFFQKQFPDG